MDLLSMAISLYITGQNVMPVIKNLPKCNCVLTARKLNPDLPFGLYSKKSKKKVVNSPEPQIGSTILTNEGFYGHAGTVIDMTGNEVTILEANYKRCAVTIRTMDIDNPKILGYYL